MQGIYQIRNIDNDKIYIGSSNNLERRWKEHQKKLNNGNHHSYKLQEDWDGYGEEYFVFEILEEGEFDLFGKEQEYLDKYKSYEFGYNVLQFANGKDYYKNNTRNNEDKFCKVFFEELQIILPELTNDEKIFLFSVIPYVSYEDNCLKYTNGKPIATKDLIRLVGISRSQTYETIKSLVNKKLLYKIKNGKTKNYFINPKLFSKGRKINEEVLAMFK